MQKGPVSLCCSALDQEIVHCTTFNKHFLWRKCAVNMANDSDGSLGERGIGLEMYYWKNWLRNQRPSSLNQRDLKQFPLYSEKDVSRRIFPWICVDVLYMSSRYIHAPHYSLSRCYLSKAKYYDSPCLFFLDKRKQPFRWKNWKNCLPTRPTWGLGCCSFPPSPSSPSPSSSSPSQSSLCQALHTQCQAFC